MRKLLLIFISILLITASSFAQEDKPLYQDGKIWFKVKADYPVFMKMSFKGEDLSNPMNLPLNTLEFLLTINDQFQFENLSRPFHMAKGYEPLENTYLIEFSDFQNADILVKALEDIDVVEYAERVPMNYSSYSPNDPYYNTSNLWGLFKINAANAWNYSTGSSAITVAVVDNAIDITHSDLSGNIWTNPGEIASNGVDDDGNGYIDDVNGWDSGDDDNNPNPPNTSFDHGTHVSGTVGASTDNNTGVASIGFGISIMPVKATANSANPSSVTNGYDGIIYAAASGADVINMSWGGYGYSTTGQNVINYAHNQGCVIVAAAGNDDVTTSHYPSSYNYVISVASSASSDQKSSFSNYGSDIDVTAPGSSIYSTMPGGGYAYKSGTSMASPLVAGLCGLMLSLNPALTSSDIETCLVNTCVNIDTQNPSYINQLGGGRIDAAAAMSCVSATLSYAPVPDFVANTTTVAAGGAVTFTDLTIYNSTSWQWTFTGGTPSSYTGQNPPTITYNTQGTYNVSLYVTNSNGNNTELKNNYITVTAPNSCDTLTNTEAGDNVYIRSFTGNGYFPGHNGYTITAWADKFTNTYPAGTYIQFIDYYFVEGMTNSATAFITATVWDATGTGGSPGSVVASENVLLQTIEDNQTGTGFYPTRVRLDNPVALPSGDFFIGFTLTHAAGDTVCLASTQDVALIAGRSNTLWGYDAFGGGIWEDMTATYTLPEINTHVYVYATTYPVTANISPATATICDGDYVNFSSTGSTNQTIAHWYFNGSSTDTTSAANPSVMFDTPGTHTQFLVSYNTCGFYHVDSSTVTVNPTPNVTVTSALDTICPSASTQLTASGATNYSWTPTTGLSNPSIANPIASPATTTTYTVEGDDGTCSDDVSITIVVDQDPVADYSYSPAALCNGVDIQFDGSISIDASSYYWTFTNGSISNSSQIFPVANFPIGSNNVKLVVTNSCNVKDSVTYSLNVNALPTKPNLGIDFIECINTPIALDAGTGYSSYSWTGGTSSTNILNVSSSTAGAQTYTVIVTNASGCEEGDTIQITYQTCTNINDLNEAGISIYPNPAENSFNISIESINDKIAFAMYNSIGELVKNMELNGAEDIIIHSIDIADLASGIYVIELRTKDKVFIEKLHKR
jgi:serine protease